MYRVGGTAESFEEVAEVCNQVPVGDAYDGASTFRTEGQSGFYLTDTSKVEFGPFWSDKRESIFKMPPEDEMWGDVMGDVSRYLSKTNPIIKGLKGNVYSPENVVTGNTDILTVSCLYNEETKRHDILDVGFFGIQKLFTINTFLIMLVIFIFSSLIGFVFGRK
jgi:hypothetical protein